MKFLNFKNLSSKGSVFKTLRKLNNNKSKTSKMSINESPKTKFEPKYQTVPGFSTMLKKSDIFRIWNIVSLQCIYKELFSLIIIVSSIKTALAAKDAEIETYKATLEDLRHQLAGLQMDTDKTSLVMLQQVTGLVIRE